MKILNYLTAALIVSATAISSCKKDKSEHPEIQTTSLSVAQNGVVTFSGNILKTGTFDVLDYGFIYSSSSNFDENTGIKISLGASPSTGNFSKEAMIYASNTSLRRLYGRAFLKNANGTAYGSISYVDLPISSAGNISPQSGKAGDLVDIFGQFYASNASQVRILFGSSNAEVVSFSNSKITFKVPTGVVSTNYDGTVNIQILINNTSLGSSYSFRLAPTFSSFMPASATFGGTVKIYGSGFNTYPTSIQVFFGDVLASSYVNSATEITATVPFNINAQKVKITVVVNGVKSILADDFTLVTPTITDMTPTSGTWGTAIELSGTGLPTGYGNATVAVGGFSVTNSYYSSNNKITVNIPYNASLAEGEHEVKINWGFLSSVSPKKFKLIAPNIDSFSPSSASPGEDITLKGTFFPSTNYSIQIGSQTVYAKSISASTLVVTVPASTTNTGKAKVSMIANGKTFSANSELTIISPTISSFTPTSGVVGEVITINGTGFNSYSGVMFGGRTATVTSITPTQIKAIVPIGLSVGALKIAVNVYGQTVTATDNFTFKN